MSSTNRYLLITCSLITAAGSSASAGTIESITGDLSRALNPIEIAERARLDLPPADTLIPKHSSPHHIKWKDTLTPLDPDPIRAHGDVPDFPEARSKKPNPNASPLAERLDIPAVDLRRILNFGRDVPYYINPDQIEDLASPNPNPWQILQDADRSLSTPADAISAKPAKLSDPVLIHINAIPTPGSGLLAVLSVGLLAGRRRR